MQALAESSPDRNPHREDEPYRRALVGIYARLAATLQALTGTEALRHAEAAVQNRPQTARVSQVQLDRQDGLCLLLLERLMRAFERGHDLDPTIPRLVPLSTRSVIGRAGSGHKSAPPDPLPVPGTAPAPTPA